MTHRNDNQKQTVLPTSNFHQFGLAGVITSSATPPQVFLSSLPAWFLLHRLNRFTSQQPIRSKPMEQRVKRQDDEASMCCHFATFCFGHISFAHTQCFVLVFFYFASLQRANASERRGFRGGGSDCGGNVAPPTETAAFRRL